VLMSHDIHHIKIDLWHIGIRYDIDVLHRYDVDAERFGGVSS